MEDEDGRDLFPVKDVNIGQKQSIPEEKNSNILLRMVSKWTREQLEDRYFCIAEENLVLKKHNIKQEDKIKKMATKLIRLINDKKKQEKSSTGSKKRDVETEQLIEELQDKIRDLEKQNKILTDKLLVLRQQFQTQLKKPSFGAYRHLSVPARVDSGNIKSNVRPSSEVIQNSTRVLSNPTFPQSLLQEESQNRENPIIFNRMGVNYQEQIELYQQRVHSLEKQLEVKREQYEDEIITLKSQLSLEQKQVLQDNVSTIKLQRELKHKISQVTFLEKSCQDLKAMLVTNNEKQEQLLKKLDSSQQSIFEAENKISELKAQLNTFATTNVALTELKEKNSDLYKENKVLKELNERLMESTLNAGKTRVSKETRTELPVSTSIDHSLKLRNLELEKLNHHLNQELEKEKSMQLELDAKLREVQLKFEKIENEYFNSSRNNGEEIQKTMDKVMLNINKKNESELQALLDIQREENGIDSLKLKLIKEQANHAETIHELERTRDMLNVQHKINKNYELEVEVVTNRLKKFKTEFDEQLAIKDDKLHSKSVKIEILEEQIKSLRLTESTLISGADKIIQKPQVKVVSTENNENVIHIKIIACKFLKSKIEDTGTWPSSVFCTYKFKDEADHETPSVTNSIAPKFDDHQVFIVKMNDDLEKYLSHESLEVFVFGTNASGATVNLGAATIPISKLSLNKEIKKEFQLIKDGDNYGTIEIHIFWHLPYLIQTSTSKESPKVIEEEIKNSIVESVQKTHPHLKPKVIEEEIKNSILDSVQKIPPQPKPKLIEEEVNNLIVDGVQKIPLQVKPKVIEEKTKTSIVDSAQKIPPQPKPRTTKIFSSPPELVAEVTGSTVEIPIVVSSTTSNHCFSSGSSDESDNEVEEPKINKDEDGESDSDVIVTKLQPVTHIKLEEPVPRASVVVSYLKLSSKSLLKNTSVSMIFVEYYFLGFPAEELETPFALPKPKNLRSKMLFNFTKSFELDVDKRKLLSQMINSPSKAKLKFTIVSEPPDDKEDAECEDIGVAYADLDKIKITGKDIIQQNINVMDIKKHTKVIGQLNVTVEIANVLKWIEKEKLSSN